MIVIASFVLFGVAGASENFELEQIGCTVIEYVLTWAIAFASGLRASVRETRLLLVNARTVLGGIR